MRDKKNSNDDKMVKKKVLFLFPSFLLDSVQLKWVWIFSGGGVTATLDNFHPNSEASNNNNNNILRWKENLFD